MTRRRNTELEALLAEFGYTHQAFADEVNRLAVETFGEPANCTDRHVRRWIAGHVRCPWPRHLRLLEHILGRSAHDMGFSPRTEQPAHVPPQVRNKSTTPDAEAPPPMDAMDAQLRVQRRTFLAGALVAALGTDQAPRTGRLGMSDVARARSTTARLDAHFNGLGGGAMVDVAANYLRGLQRALNHCTSSERVERAMSGVVAAVAACAGWSAHDCGDYALASRFRNEALQAALLARDRTAVTRAWSDLAVQAKQTGRPAEAARIARAALAERHVRSEPLIASLLHARLADYLARTDDVRGMARHLVAADRAHDRADTTGVPSWLAFLTPAELSGLSALAHQSAGQYVRAEQQALRTLDLLGGDFPRNRTFYTMLIAELQLAQGERDRASATIATVRTGTVTSSRIGDRLARVATAAQGGRT
ncbi:hypothetical protein [Streptomyces aureocirculatus]|uniref:hypothetical protein n=1 Tax=Streptomyces aureocirculatus TaxID=67275 RepID=UPI00068E2D1F|nr:hypothetical protein [Streptomyces aureocirculatus]